MTTHQIKFSHDLIAQCVFERNTTVLLFGHVDKSSSASLPVALQLVIARRTRISPNHVEQFLNVVLIPALRSCRRRRNDVGTAIQIQALPDARFP